MTRARTMALCALVLLPALALAEPDRGGGDDLGGGRPRMPTFLRQLFRPEVVMRNQEAIGLTAEQRDAISGAMNTTQQKLTNLRWQIEAKGETTTPLFSGDRIDPGPALAAAGEMMDLEEQVKREHLALLVTVKNLLTPEQQKKLREIEPEAWERRRR
jgi:Spy/CpxP family protein refolding chaperone